MSEEDYERRYIPPEDYYEEDRLMDRIERRIHAREDPCAGCEEDMGY